MEQPPAQPAERPARRRKTILLAAAVLVPLAIGLAGVGVALAGGPDAASAVPAVSVRVGGYGETVLVVNARVTDLDNDDAVTLTVTGWQPGGDTMSLDRVSARPGDRDDVTVQAGPFPVEDLQRVEVELLTPGWRCRSSVVVEGIRPPAPGIDCQPVDGVNSARRSRPAQGR